MPKKLVLFFIALFFGNYALAEKDSLFIVSDIQIIGNKKTKSDIVFREIALEIGDKLTEQQLNEQLDATKNNLLNSSLFNFVTIDKTFNNGNVIVVIVLEERWYLWPYPIFEYADRNVNIWFKEKDYNRLNYGIHVIKYNFRGRREIVNVKLRLGFREQYQLYYENPYLDKEKKFGFYFGIAHFRQKEIPYILNENIVNYLSDDEYLQNELYSDIGVYYRNHFYLKHHFSFSYRQSNVDDTIIALNPYFHASGEKKMRFLKIGYELDYDTRDSKVYPLNGLRFYFSISQTGLGIVNDIDKAVMQLNWGAQINKNLTTKFYSASTLKLKATFLNTPPYLFKSGLGYDDFLRGFEFYVIQGEKYFLLSNDLKFNFLPEKIFKFEFLPAEKFNKTFLSGFINAFFDVGYVSSSTTYLNDYMSNMLLYSGGIGVDFVTYYDKILRINYAINTFNEKNIYLHFKIPF